MITKAPLNAVAFLLLIVAGSVAHAVPSEVDWRTKGVVTSVQDQGDGCNYSWAFAATGAIEGAISIAHGTLVNLSEQQLIDCGGICGAPAAAQCGCPQLGCAFSYTGSNGLCTEAAYAYTAQAGTCQQASCTAAPFTTSLTWSPIPPGSETDLVAALVAGPVVARLEVGNNGQPLPAYALYSSGVLVPPPSDSTVVQWVLVVGYTPTYFIIKNSLGTGWGEAGYLRLARGGNYFGVANFAYAVNVGADAAPVAAVPCEAVPSSVPALSLGATAGLVLLLGLVALTGFRSRRTI